MCNHKDCQHHSKFSHNDTAGYCDYLCHTGKPRGCPSGKCDKYLPKHKSNQKCNLMISQDADKINASNIARGIKNNIDSTDKAEYN